MDWHLSSIATKGGPVCRESWLHMQNCKLRKRENFQTLKKKKASKLLDVITSLRLVNDEKKLVMMKMKRKRVDGAVIPQLIVFSSILSPSFCIIIIVLVACNNYTKSTSDYCTSCLCLFRRKKIIRVNIFFCLSLNKKA